MSYVCFINKYSIILGNSLEFLYTVGTFIKDLIHATFLTEVHLNKLKIRKPQYRI